MSTQLAYRQRMIALANDYYGFGRTAAITALAAQTVTCSSLATGSVSSSKYQGWYLLRPNAANVADRLRICSAFAPATGVFTHAGAAYVDTTATGETLELHQYDPLMLDNAINLALGRLRRRDIETIPTSSAPWAWLGQLDWINEPGDVDLVKLNYRAVLSRNRYFQKWNSINPATAALGVAPDWWTLSGASNTGQRVTSGAGVYRAGQYAWTITRAGTNVTATQSIGLLTDGVDGESMAGKIATAVLRCYSTSASQIRVAIDDGVTVSTSAYHTGNSTVQELTKQVTLSNSATKLDLIIQVNVDGSPVISECYLVYGAISDGVRRDDVTSIEIPKSWDQSAGPGALRLNLPTAYGFGSQIEVHSRRAYPSLTLDTDTADAPLTTIAAGALWLLYRGLSQTPGQDVQRYAQIGEHWRGLYGPLAAKHYAQNFGGYGVQMPPAMLTAFPTRVG